MEQACEFKLKSSFPDTLNPSCSCDFDFEKNTRFTSLPLVNNQRCIPLRTVDDDDIDCF